MTLTGKISITETSCHPLEYVNLNCILITTMLHLKKVRVVKARIRSTILTSVVQDGQNNIQPASNSNSESDSDSDRVECISGFSSNSNFRTK